MTNIYFCYPKLTFKPLIWIINSWSFILFIYLYLYCKSERRLDTSQLQYGIWDFRGNCGRKTNTAEAETGVTNLERFLSSSWLSYKEN